MSCCVKYIAFVIFLCMTLLILNWPLDAKGHSEIFLL